LTIQQVALVTGHRDWKILKRYTHLRPEDLHKVLGQAPLVRHSDRVESAPKVAQLLNPAIPSSTSLAPIIRDRKSAR
jgi:hypothetical protein